MHIHRLTPAILGPLWLLSLLVVGPIAPAKAGRAKASVYLVQDRLPPKLSEKALLRFARKHHGAALQETKEEDVEDRRWKANLVVAFSQPVGDLEFQVLFYDVEGGAPKLVEDMSTFVSDRRQKTFVQALKLPRKRFKPNRKMELVVTVKRQEVARVPFRLVGEEKRHSGRVDFGDDER